MEERKRQLNDSYESAGTPEGGSSDGVPLLPPPSKKQATLARGINVTASNSMAMTDSPDRDDRSGPVTATTHSQPMSPYPTTTNGPSDIQMDTDNQEKSPAEKLLIFQKEAIWRQMQEYKRECQRMEYDIQQLEVSREHFYSLAGQFDGFWHKIQNEIQALVAPLNIDSSTVLHNASANIDHDTIKPNGFLDQQVMRNMDTTALDAWLENKVTVATQLLQQTTQRVQAIVKERDAIANDITVQDEADIINLLKKENSRLKSEKELVVETSAELHTQKTKLNDECGRMSSALTVANDQLRETSRQNEELRYELKRAERTIDRLKSSTEPVVPLPASEPYSNINTDKSSASVAASASATGTTTALATANSTMQAHTEISSVSEMGHIEAVQRLADNRLQELCQVKDDKIRMTQEIDYLRMQLSYLPDERIIETPLFQRLQDNCNYYRDDVERQRASVESAQTEIEELRTNRRQYMEQVQTEERKRREVLESELRRLENDLTRVRGNRDHLQQQLELRCSKDNTELVQHQEIRVIANTRKDQITTLTTEIQRLKMKIAADAGDREAFDYYSVNEELSLVDQLRKQVKTMEEQVKTLQDENSTLKAVEAVSNEETRSELEKALSTQTQLQNELKEANDRVKVIDQRFGTLAKADDPLRQLVEQLEAQTKLVKDLELKCEFYQKTESQLMSEIENISKEWFQLEEKSSRKILDIATKEDQIVQLLAEKTKYDQKYGMLHKQKDSLSNVNIALRRQSEKQLEQIRRLEEHEKNLDQQLANLERELASVNTTLQQFKERLVHANRQLEETTEKINKSDLKFVELQNLLKERTQAYEDGAHARRRLAEERDALQQRVDQLTRQLAGVPGAGNEETERLLDEYKTLLKCGSCNLRFKSHVLSRCMHVFCKECIDSRIETRQRKCPICGDAFGVNDVRQIYL